MRRTLNTSTEKFVQNCDIDWGDAYCDAAASPINGRMNRSSRGWPEKLHSEPGFDTRTNLGSRSLIRIVGALPRSLLLYSFNHSPSLSTLFLVKNLERSVISFATFSPFRILRDTSIASLPPVGYSKLAARTPCFTYILPS